MKYNEPDFDDEDEPIPLSVMLLAIVGLLIILIAVIGIVTISSYIQSQP